MTESGKPDQVRWAITFGHHHSGELLINLAASLGGTATAHAGRLMASFPDVMGAMIDFDPSVTTAAVLEALEGLEFSGWITQQGTGTYVLTYPVGVEAVA